MLMRVLFDFMYVVGSGCGVEMWFEMKGCGKDCFWRWLVGV